MNQRGKFWWEASKEELPDEVFGHVENLKTKQGATVEKDRRHLRLYGNTNILGIGTDPLAATGSLEKITLNVVQAAIDTAQARIAKNKVKPRFLTSGGDYKLERKAQKLEKYISGVYYNQDLYTKAPKAFVYGAVFGTGTVNIFPDYNKKQIAIENVNKSELITDEDEALYGHPLQFHRQKYTSRDTLAHLYPKFKNDIYNAESGIEDDFLIDAYSADLVKVIESHRLVGSANAQGRHCICISNKALMDEEWQKDWFPYEHFQYNDRLIGFWGRGIAEMITGIQIEINKLLRTIQLAMHLGSIPKVFIEAGSKIVSSHINNEIGGIIKYLGTKPEAASLMNVPVELFTQLENLYVKAFEQVGLNLMSATGRKPAELESGKAMREYTDIENERFAIVSQNYEQFHINMVKKIIAVSKEMAAKDPDFAVKTYDADGVEFIKWKDVEIEEEAYVLQVYPSNFLSSTPSGRLADVEHLMDRGLIDQKSALSLLSFPDLERFSKFKNASEDQIYKTIEKIVDEAVVIPPTEFMDLELGIQMMQNAFVYYQSRDLEIDRLDLFTMWIDQALALQAAAVEDIQPGMTADDVAAAQAATEEQQEIDQQLQQIAQ